ncbi:glycine-rich protein 1 isoform X2 [Drosophila albomicans]|uniref:Glycine-rich protein 1 isoform X2 n=1 Tax=Drosophila albomicans TaxID=7291 RepID=A0A9C6W409_DROAB|nr:glycine-rich protein 1 isoform X2 [Drosophila albomicans]
MLMLPLLEYNKHIAKIPNCKMRSSPLRLSMLHLLLLLWMLLGAAATSSSSNSNGNSNGPSAAAGAAGGASAASGAGGGGGGGAAAAGPGLPPGALNANLTDLGSPGFCTSSTINQIIRIFDQLLYPPQVIFVTIIFNACG